MHQRPVGILVDALRNLGAKITYLADTGYPPLLITGTSLNGSIIDLNSSISSQFISSILLISPQFPKGLTINLTNRIVSAPYIDMTLKLMKYFGVNSVISQGKIAVKHQAYRPETIIVEPDWSSASFWYEITALAENPEIFIEGLKKNSIQGDAVLPEIYRNLGVRTEYLFDGIRITKTNRLTDHFEFDFTHYPDLALPVIATCAGLGIRGFFTGLENLTIKETNRLEALNKELNEMGFGSRIVAGNGLEISGKKRDSFPDKVHLTKSYGDHRMAMSFAPLAILFGEMLIDEPEVISKSYPGFWNEIKKVGFLTDLIV
jgi:3-phosphoshikimate 1-carboxyvinyltransferase